MALGRLGKCCRSLLHAPSKGVFFGVLQPGWIESCIGAKRHLLSEDVIKLEDFQQRKLAVAHLVTGSKGNYIELFSQKLLRNELVLRDELKLLLHLCQSADDMVIARDAIYRYHAENRNLAYGEFKFGPLFMRLCYELGLEEMAAATITDKNMIGFFNDATSFNITIDMLFTKGLYENALEVLRTMRNQNISFNKDTLTLATGICYKLNTAESYRICTALIEEKQAKGYFIPRHAYCFAIALALRRNDIEKAQSLYSQIMNTDSRICQNLKVDLLRLQSEGGPHMPKVEQLVTQLEQAGQVIQQTLDDLLCHTHKGNRRKQAPVLEERRTSRRTLRPLQSTLLSE
ncbi:pentatricopeptide repeat-containing protein 2, mitochondrial isoform X2 [Channa argus]|uniref:pentatricopeptide repeat-containing protein 2, mitochondrial isoform X2 n=1 Tax=Channa argus TaxID=215402 RepID=UPI0035229253